MLVDWSQNTAFFWGPVSSYLLYSEPPEVICCISTYRRGRRPLIVHDMIYQTFVTILVWVGSRYHFGRKFVIIEVILFWQSH